MAHTHRLLGPYHLKKKQKKKRNWSLWIILLLLLLRLFWLCCDINGKVRSQCPTQPLSLLSKDNVSAQKSEAEKDIKQCEEQTRCRRLFSHFILLSQPVCALVRLNGQQAAHVIVALLETAAPQLLFAWFQTRLNPLSLMQRIASFFKLCVRAGFE